ncbi:unnamed protein product [Peronospora belbahrii]|uniref:BRCT domain-containing protein n=1 Tax=Peronospora belbahrii TaxID=622444 RepID=A0AAU9L2E9_9STRA|nr:unnamed protein product [Peronospora belbahrii]
MASRPRPTSPISSSMDAYHVSPVSFPQPSSPLQCSSVNSTDSQQCSADPDAFLGFQVSRGVSDMKMRRGQDVQHENETLKLVLDLQVTTRDVRRDRDEKRVIQDVGVSGDPFRNLFHEETQDEENVVPIVSSLTGKKKMKMMKKKKIQGTDSCVKKTRLKQGCEKKRAQRICPVMLNSAWKHSYKKKVVDSCDNRQLQEAGKKKEEEECGDGELMPAFSEYSEDLAPQIFETACMSLSNDDDTDGCEKEQGQNSLVLEHREKFDTSGFDEESKSEEEYRNDMDCTQQLIEEDGYTDETRNYEERDDEETEVYPSSENETLPYAADSVLQCNNSNHNQISSEQEKVVSVDYSADRLDVVPTARRTSDQPNGEDEVMSREGSQATQEEYLTPRVNPSRIGQSDPAEMNVESVSSLSVNGDVEQISKTLQHDDDQDECIPTQPSKVGTEDEPLVESDSSSQRHVKKSDEWLTRKHTTGADNQTKAMRSLELSLFVPESQEGEPHLSASIPANSTPAAKRVEASTGSNESSFFSSSTSPVCLPTSTPTQLSVDDPTTPKAAVDNQSSPKRKTVSSLQSDLPSDKKKPKTISQVIDSPCQTTSTPIAPRRSSAPANSNASSQKANGSDASTPRHHVRRSSRSTQSTPSSTPTVRTRIRSLTAVPVQRTYASRSRTLFKYKFEFCLTGFVKTGEQHLKELIEGHGGKIPERYQDVLNKRNSKAIVIATAVSWRKRKFMQAVACGIPVVHTDWIKNCIEVGHVIPFDGYQVPIGYSVTTRKFECCPPKELQIFEDYSFGIASDVSQVSKAEAKDKANLMTFILKACGAKAVYENLLPEDSVNVDVVLCDEYTPTCRYYRKMRHIPVKDFQWVTECVVLQQLLDPKEPAFGPLRVGSEDQFAASAEIGDSDNTTLKLYKGELVIADIAGSAADHYLLFNVCEILSIHLSGHKDEASQTKRKDCKENQVMLRVGMLKREPYNPELSKTFVKVLDISSYQVKRRVVAISKKHYSQLKYRDESIFYLKDDEPNMSTASEHERLTQ